MTDQMNMLQPVAAKPQVSALVRVMVPLYLPKFLDYAWAAKIPPKVGQFVAVEVGKKKVHGLVVALPDEAPTRTLKPAEPVEAPQLAPQMVDFLRWVARYNLTVPGDPLRALLMAGQAPEPMHDKMLVRTGEAPEKLTPQRRAVLDKAETPHETMQALATAAAVSSAVVQGLVKQSVLSWQKIVDEAPTFSFSHVDLNPAQAEAAGELRAALAQKAFAPILLDGVTGSGKTEVYFDTVEQVLREEKGQVLLLVPEIALTPQLIARFEKRFGVKPVIWHSSVSETQRRRAWWGVANGTARIVLGARSALFLPWQNLRLLVVDEEHEPSYKQEDIFRYHGRDMAVALARHWACPVVLTSATPSLETWHNAMSGRYKCLHLPSRYGEAQLPRVGVIDLRGAKPAADHWLAPPLLEEVIKVVEKGEQALLFLNRRGTAPLMLCHDCGHRFDCPRCDASLVVHGTAERGRLVCHHCGFSDHWPQTCANCESENLYAFGPGTRKVVKELQEAMPDVRVGLADSDAIRTPQAMGELIENLQNGKLDVVVGTQMVAKGHHFPDLTLVGVIDADMGLAHGDVRAAERTFQLLTQVSGRAGRAAKAGQVLLQTHNPEHPVIQALTSFDRERFYNEELKARRHFGDPPFGRLTALVLSGKKEADVAKAGQMLARSFPKAEGLRLLGPAVAPLARLNDRYRYRLLLKSQKSPHETVQNWLGATPLPSSVKVVVDVDPQSFF